MEKQEYVVLLSEEKSQLLQKKQYEFNAKAAIVTFLAQDRAIDWDVMQDEITDAEVASVELDLAKSTVSFEALQDNNIDIDTQYFSWRLDYYEHTLTFTQEAKIPQVFSSVTIELEDADLDEIEKKQFEYNAAANIMSMLKESTGTNPEIVKEYNKVLVQRRIDLDMLKGDLANKYNKDKLDLSKHDWSIEFNKKTITFNEVLK